jgi:hypothetical protein
MRVDTQQTYYFKTESECKRGIFPGFHAENTQNDKNGQSNKVGIIYFATLVAIWVLPLRNK